MYAITYVPFASFSFIRSSIGPTEDWIWLAKRELSKNNACVFGNRNLSFNGNEQNGAVLNSICAVQILLSISLA
jgi:hypothetical protein